MPTWVLVPQETTLPAELQHQPPKRLFVVNICHLILVMVTFRHCEYLPMSTGFFFFLTKPNLFHKMCVVVEGEGKVMKLLQ